jgi:hypothetical protein
MANQDFKTAAAKLLAQHSCKPENNAPKPLVKQKEPATMPTLILPVQEERAECRRKQSEPEIERVILPVWDSSEEAKAQDTARPAKWKFIENKTKVSIMFGLIILFSAIMVVLVPSTRIGIIGNILVGVLAGGGFGYIINREL